MRYKSILTIYNPHSGKKKLFTKRIIKRELDKYQAYKEWLTTTKDFDMGHIEWKKFDLVLVAGGDGTVRQVAEILYKKNIDIPIAIIPIGSANLLAFSFGVPWGLRRSIRFALSQKSYKIDAGLVNNKHLFLIGLSVGLDAKMIGLTPRHWKKVYGFFAYLISALSFVFSPEDYSFVLTVDGKKIVHRAVSIMVLNNGNFFGINLAPKLSVVDGKLNVMAIHTANFIKLIGMFFKILRGRFDKLSGDITYHMAKTVVIKASESVEVEIDGEPFDLDKLQIRVLPKVISVISKKI